ncbi:MAG: LCP family protein [Clostridia bacterium]|nr:LCP family protein [Clostridia bacterium]
MNKKVYFATLGGILAFFILVAFVGYVFIFSSLSGICGSLELDGLKEDYDKVVNVLAIGVDGSETRSDTILLASMNLEDKTVSLMSIPRDTRVRYNGSWDKITHLFSYDTTGQLTLDVVKDITGVDIHYVGIINFDGFSNAIDELGGVDVEVPDLGKGGMYYNDPVQDLNIALPAGYRHLNGQEAQGFVRFRSGYANADLGRIETQRYFLQELVKQKLKFKYIAKVPAVFEVLEGDFRTNYGCSDIISQMIKMLGMKSENIKSYSLPGESGMASTRYGYLSCFIYDKEETADLISKYFTE